jgi:hypothetical protein
LEGTFNKIAAGGIIVFMEPELLVGYQALCIKNLPAVLITF